MLSQKQNQKQNLHQSAGRPLTFIVFHFGYHNGHTHRFVVCSSLQTQQEQDTQKAGIWECAYVYIHILATPRLIPKAADSGTKVIVWEYQSRASFLGQRPADISGRVAAIARNHTASG